VLQEEFEMGFIKMLDKIVLCLGLATSVTMAQYAPPTAISNLLNNYRGYSNLTSVATNNETYAVNITTWQMYHGGFSKANESNYLNPWNGSASLSEWYSGSTPLGMYDNNATVSEIRFLANQYKVSGSTANKNLFREAIAKGIDFILISQQTNGSWPQVYPARTGTTYSNMATFNDNAMVRLMVMVKDIIDSRAPFDSDIVSAADKSSLQTALTKSVQFALNAQIRNGNKLTVWCQQHDPLSYAPVGARAYELPSKSGSESVGITAFLMNWPQQTTEVQAAVRGAVQWYIDTRVPDMRWQSPDFVSSPGSSLWYRFYNVEDDRGFFCDRDGVKVYDITQISMERREGYQWGGSYGTGLITAYASYNPPSVSSSSAAPSSSSTALSSSSIGISSSSLSCGASNCTTSIQGEDFCSAMGILESSNTGFAGLGYLNFDNQLGADAGYVVDALNSGNYTLYIRYANGSTVNRPLSIKLGNQILVPEVAFAPTANWTTWSILSVSLQLPAGRDSLVLVSSTDVGGPNIDWIGWSNSELRAGSCEVPTFLETSFNQPRNSIQAHILESVLYLNWTPFGDFDLTFRALSGEILQIVKANQNAISVQSLPKGLFLVEMRQGSHSLGHFTVPNF
jgi:PelA/Pel-15E family pectate lyase